MLEILNLPALEHAVDVYNAITLQPCGASCINAKWKQNSHNKMALGHRCQCVSPKSDAAGNRYTKCITESSRRLVLSAYEGDVHCAEYRTLKDIFANSPPWSKIQWTVRYGSSILTRISHSVTLLPTVLN